MYYNTHSFYISREMSPVPPGVRGSGKSVYIFQSTRPKWDATANGNRSNNNPPSVPANDLDNHQGFYVKMRHFDNIIGVKPSNTLDLHHMYPVLRIGLRSLSATWVCSATSSTWPTIGSDPTASGCLTRLGRGPITAQRSPNIGIQCLL